jgi:hypothetical protein
MDSRITAAARPDIVMIESAPRPTPTPERVTFNQVLSAGANGLVQGAELVASALPGSPVTAAAVRGGSMGVGASAANGGGLSLNTTAEGPGGATPSSLTLSGAISTLTGATSSTSTTSSTDQTGSIDASLQQSAQLNLYYLQIQEQVDSQNRSFTALSNVLKTEHDSAKAAIQNIHS